MNLLKQFRLPGKGWISIAVVGITLSCWAATKLNQVAIENSTIDSSNIGTSQPGTAAFTQAQITSGPSSFPTQGTYLGWNKEVQGETDFFNHKGTGVGGFYFLNGSSTQTVLAYLDSSGNFHATDFSGTLLGNVTGNVTGTLSGNSSGTLASYQNMLIYGNDTLALAGSAGLNLAWNQNGGSAGESDFVNQQSTGSTGGFAWYNTTTHSLVSPIMQLSAAGNLIVNTVTANLTGAVTGNASTATALATAPSNCAAGQATPGINALGQSQACETAVYAQKGTVAFTSQTFANSSYTYFTESFSLGSTPAAGSVVKCSPQSDFGNEVQYSCWTSGATLYIKITHGQYNLPYTVPTTNVNYFIES